MRFPKMCALGAIVLIWALVDLYGDNGSTTDQGQHYG
jgi:hypothetical protein